ncbi:MAG: hypothetical protein WBY61_18895 [Terriglobales bacterium]
MAQNEWQRRIQRAEELGTQYSFAAEILGFYVAVARFQESLSRELAKSFTEPISASGSAASDSDWFARRLPPAVARQFGEFLSVVEQSGPTPLR